MAASSAENRMNLAALQQCDPYIDGIVQTATQVALYTFNGSANEWEKTDIEGSLFVYSRSATPHNGFMIMNRLSMHNLTEPVTKDLEFQHQDPFLLYRNAKSIYGLWFYDKKECARVTQVMNGLVQKAKQRSKTKTRRRSASETGSGGPPTSNGRGQPGPVDIMQMLSKAQDEFNQSHHQESSEGSSGSSKIAIGSPTIVRPIPVKAKDSSKKQQTQRSSEDRDRMPGELKGPSSKSQQQQPRFQRSVSMQEASTMPPALQKILQSGATQRNIDHPLTKGEVMTVGSLEDVHTKASKKSTTKPKESGQFRTVESIENIHGAAGSKGAPHTTGQSVPIQNLLAQLQQQQQPNQAKDSIVPSKGTIPHAASESSLTALLTVKSDTKPVPIPEGSSQDLNQALLANLSTPKSSGLLLPHQLTQGSSSPSSSGSSSLRHVQSQPLLGAEGGGYQVPSLQQIAAGGVQPESGGGAPGDGGNTFLHLQAPGSGESSPSMQTSPQRIPASVAPPTLLTPQSFRQRATSDVIASPAKPLLPSSTTLAFNTSDTTQGTGDTGIDRRKTVPTLSIGIGGMMAQQTTASVDPLTKDQFRDAFIQLLRTDDDFVGKLHNAYMTTQQ